MLHQCLVIGIGSSSGRGLAGSAHPGDHGADDTWRSEELSTFPTLHRGNTDRRLIETCMNSYGLYLKIFFIQITANKKLPARILEEL